jgi:hypothetical protein
MAESIVLKLSKAEALSLRALAENSAEPFFTVVDGDKGYELDGWTNESAARACDKLREVTLGKPFPQDTWAQFLTELH